MASTKKFKSRSTTDSGLNQSGGGSTDASPSRRRTKRSRFHASSPSASTSRLATSPHPTTSDQPPIPIDRPLAELKGSNQPNRLFLIEVKLLSDEETPITLEVSQWIEMTKNVYKQLKHVCPRSLNFRVKHYPADPVEELTQEKARYLLYLQLRRDLHSGRLIGRNSDMHKLAACILQAEIGDYDQLVDYLGDEGSLSDLKMFANVTPKTENRIIDLHKTLKGLSMSEAENRFLTLASKFETYGIEPIYVQDRKGNHFYMGLSHEGVVTFRGSRKAHVFSWEKVHKISFEGKLFIIQVEWEQRRHTLGFKCPTPDASEALWKWAVDRQSFFTGRCQKELILMNSSLPNLPQPSVSRSRSLLNLAKNVKTIRQSRSQGDLDRKFDDDEDGGPDEVGDGPTKTSSLPRKTPKSGLTSLKVDVISTNHNEETVSLDESINQSSPPEEGVKIEDPTASLLSPHTSPTKPFPKEEEKQEEKPDTIPALDHTVESTFQPQPPSTSRDLDKSSIKTTSSSSSLHSIDADLEACNADDAVGHRLESITSASIPLPDLDALQQHAHLVEVIGEVRQEIQQATVKSQSDTDQLASTLVDQATSKARLGLAEASPVTTTSNSDECVDDGEDSQSEDSLASTSEKEMDEGSDRERPHAIERVSFKESGDAGRMNHDATVTRIDTISAKYVDESDESQSMGDEMGSEDSKRNFLGASNGNNNKSNVLEEELAAERERIRREREVKDSSDHYFPHAYKRPEEEWNSTNSQNVHRSVRPTHIDIPQQIDLSGEHFSHTRFIPARPQMAVVHVETVDELVDPTSSLTIDQAKWTTTPRRSYDLSPQPRDWFSDSLSRSPSVGANQYTFANLMMPSPSTGRSERDLSGVEHSGRSIGGLAHDSNQSTERINLLDSSGLPHWTSSGSVAKESNWYSSRPSGSISIPASGTSRQGHGNRELSLENGYRPNPRSKEEYTKRYSTDQQLLISTTNLPPTNPSSLESQTSPSSMLAELRRASDLATDRLRFHPTSTPTTSASGGWANFYDKLEPKHEGDAGFDKTVGGSGRTGKPSQAYLSPDSSTSSFSLPRSPLEARRSTFNDRLDKSSTMATQMSLEQKQPEAGSPKKDEDPLSMRTISNRLERSIRREVSQTQPTSMDRLSRTVLESPAMPERRLIEEASSSSWTWNQLFYCALLAFIVYKLTAWLHSSPSSSSTASPPSRHQDTSPPPVEEPPPHRSLLFTLLRTLLRWLTGF